MEATHSTRAKSVADTLLDAALYLDTYGWCQNNLTEEVTGNLPHACALGALHAVTHGIDDIECPFGTECPFKLAVDYLADFLDDGIYRALDETPAEVVWKFNDHPDTTQHLVTHALRSAGKRARVELAEQAVAS